MKAIKRTLFMLGVVASCMIQTVLAQVPQAFQYQAVARDAEGRPLPEQTVSIRLSVIPGSETAESVYSEIHTTETGSFGLVTLHVGGGENVTGDFSSIDWSTSPIYLKVEMDPSGGNDFADMGTSQLLSVPFALYAPSEITGTGNTGNLAYWTDVSTLGNMPYILYSADESLQISSKEDAEDDDPIFEVRNRDGKVVFGVYQTGVRIYVEETDKGKGSRAGFAVGGFTTGKEGETLEFLRVTHDSVRIYVSDDAAKGSRAGFAVGGFTAQKQGNSQEFLRVTPDSVRIYVSDDETKGSRGGFAVGGFTTGKGALPADFMNITSQNYFIGHLSGSTITSGLYNSILGYESGRNITEGESNAFIGYQSGYNNSTGSNNLFLGYQTGYSNTDGNYNSFMGYLAGKSNTTGVFNTFLGSFSGYSNTVGSNNTFVGDSTGYHNVNGSENTFLGTGTGLMISKGQSNVFIGNRSGEKKESGVNNVFIGTRQENIT